MGDHRDAGRRILRRRGRARTSGARCSRSATRSSRSSRSRARRRARSPQTRTHFERAVRRRANCRSRRAASNIRSAPAPVVLGAVDTVFAPRAGLSRPDRRSRSGPCIRRVPMPTRPAWSKSGPLIEPDDKDATSKAGTRRSTPPARPARASGWRARSPTRRVTATWCGGAARAPGDVLMLVRQRGAAVRGGHPRAQARGHRGRRRRPAGADRAHRGDGPDGARRRAAAAGRRSGARDRAEKPAVRPRRRATVRARLWPQGHAARGAARARPATIRCSPRRRARSTSSPQGARADRRSRSTRACSAPAAAAQRFLRAARHRGRRRARRIPQSRARLRAARDAVAAGLRRLAARGADARSSATWRWRATRCA